MAGGWSNLGARLVVAAGVGLVAATGAMEEEEVDMVEVVAAAGAGAS
jgi:hypothetical protein